MSPKSTDQSKVQAQSIRNYPSWIRMFRDPRISLTALSGLTLTLSFIPGLSLLAYFSVLCGSYEAVKSSYESIRERRLDVNLLMVFAAIGAIAVSRESDAAALLFLFSLSTTLETIAMSRTKSAIESLVRLRPSQAWRVVDGEAASVAVEDLKLGDVIRILAYESVPTDAEIVEGTSKVDQSAMTGESIPEPCTVGDKIVGGTQNLDGTLLAKVTAVVGDSALDRIVDLVKDAQENKASGERISEWFGQTYTIFVLIAFVVSLVVRSLLKEPFSEAFYLSLTLLVGLSPCALVISTPATTLSALAWCARNGILVRGGEFVERVGTIKAIAIDKTGTLTWGKPILHAILFSPFPSRGSDGTLDTKSLEWDGNGPLPDGLVTTLLEAASVEQFSNHPIASAIMNAATKTGKPIPEISDHRVISGLGVQANSVAGQILVGRESLLTKEGVTIPPPILEAIQRLQTEGNTVSLIATPAGVSVFAFSDSIRPGAAQFVKDLKGIGIQKIAILTGDRPESALSVAQKVGIEEVYAGLLPGEKTDRIKQMASTDAVMMVGDGVNDAPSLASATVGVAMGGLGSDVAMNAADIVLMHDHIERIPDLVLLGRRTVATIRVNLLFAGAMITTLTIASLVIRLPLPIAVVGHEGSTVLVILNGIRMLHGPKKKK